VMMAIVVVAAHPAGAVDEGFRGRYRVIRRQTLGTGCPIGSYMGRVHVRNVNETVRYINERVVPDIEGVSRRFRYVPGEYFPWQRTRGSNDYSLRYDRATDSAVGVRYGPQCRWHVRPVPVG
jgi:hypothetical protein